MKQLMPPIALGTAHRVGESASWSATGQALYTVDIWGCAVHRLDAGGTETVWATGEMSCAVVQGRRGPVVALERSLVALDPATGAFTTLASAPPVPPTHRFNDATVDPAGRLIIATMRFSDLGAEPTGVLLSYAQERWTTLLEGFWTLNGLAFSPDGRSLYLSDSNPRVARAWRAAYDPATGRLDAPHAFADFKGRQGRPDGAAMAADGTYWIAGVGGGRLFAFAPDGRLIHEVELPVENPTRPAFGGAALDALYVTSMADRLSRPDPDGVAGQTLRIEGLGTGHPVPLFAD